MDRTRLADLCTKVVDCPHSTPKWTDSGVVVLRSKNIRNGRLDLSDASFTDEEHFLKRTKRATPSPGDLVITREAPMGEVCRIPEGLRCCLGQRMVLLKPNSERVHSTYLLYSLMSPAVQHEIHVNEGTGSTVSNLRIPLLENLPIPSPPLPDQKAIAAILGALDDKIELNRRMNETLEAMARALFKSWFVDFDPVREKADGRQPFGMDAETAALFPSEFQDSELGKIPKGWRVEALSTVAAFQKGVSYKSADLKDSSTALVNLKSVKRGGGYQAEGLKPYAGDHKPAQVVHPGELVVAHTDLTQSAEVLGRTARVSAHPDFEKLVASLDLTIVRPRSQAMPTSFLHGALAWGGFVDHAFGFANGTTVLHLSVKALPSFRLAVPPEGVLGQHGHLAEASWQLMEKRTGESSTLAAVRDALLPKLLSGELRVKDAEKFVEKQL